MYPSLNYQCESKILEVSNQSLNQNPELQQLQQKLSADKKKQTQDLNAQYHLTQLNELLYAALHQEAYQFKLQTGLELRLILNHDFPKSSARFYVVEPLNHPLIDDSTWKIKIERKDTTLSNIVAEITRAFQQRPPEKNPLIEGYNQLKQQVNEEELLRKLQTVDLKTLLPNVPPSEYKRIIEGPQVGEYIGKLPVYKQLTGFVIELSNANESFANELLEQDQKLKQQKADLDQLVNYYEEQKRRTNDKLMQCEQIKNQFSKANLQKIMDNELNSLDELSTQKVEEMNGDIDQSLQEYIELRKKYHRLQIKRAKLHS